MNTKGTPVNSPGSVGRTLLVLGMHRSGTSALTRVLNLMGVELSSDLMPPTADNNETGFWEHREIPFIHDQLLAKMDRDWMSVSPFAERWWEDPIVAPFHTQLCEIVQREFGNKSLWGFKDPRLCFLLPLWRSILSQLNVEPCCVLIFRNPYEVAKSLASRDGISMSRAYFLWLRSVLQSERDSRGLTRAITTYEALLTSWQAEVRRIGCDLRIEWPNSIEQAAPAVEEFLRSSLRHHQMDNRGFLNDPTIPKIVRRAYSAVLDVAATGRIDDLSATFNQLSLELEATSPAVTGLVTDLEREYRQAAQGKAALSSRFDEEMSLLTARFQEEKSSLTGCFENEKSALCQQLAAAQEASAGAGESVAAAERQAVALMSEVAALTSDVAALKLELNCSNRTVGDLTVTVGQRDKDLSRRDALLSHRDQQITRRDEHLSQLMDKLSRRDEQLGQLVRQSTQIIRQLGERDERIKQLEILSGRRDEEIGRMVRRLSEQDEQLGQLDRKLAERDDHVKQAHKTLASVRAELEMCDQQRAVLLELSKTIWRSPWWRWSALLRRIRKGMIREHQLTPASSLESLGRNHWRSQGPAILSLPGTTFLGPVRIRLKMRSTVPSRAMLHLDTGGPNNGSQRLELGVFDAELDVDQTHVLTEAVHGFRLEPLQCAGEFKIERFEILPLT